MKYRPNIGPGDFETKTKKLTKFLEQGHKVKVTIMFRGREVTRPEVGEELLLRIANETGGRIELQPKLGGRDMIMILAPKK